MTASPAPDGAGAWTGHRQPDNSCRVNTTSTAPQLSPSTPSNRRRSWLLGRVRWHEHPGVRGPSQLTLGERAADRLRNGMGSWSFVLGALAFLAVWMAFNGRHGFDPYPFILLNLLLSCLAAMQGAILLIAARRADQISSELALHDYQTDCRSAELLERVVAELAEVRAELSRPAAGGQPQ